MLVYEICKGLHFVYIYILYRVPTVLGCRLYFMDINSIASIKQRNKNTLGKVLNQIKSNQIKFYL